MFEILELATKTRNHVITYGKRLFFCLLQEHRSKNEVCAHKGLSLTELGNIRLNNYTKLYVGIRLVDRLVDRHRRLVFRKKCRKHCSCMVFTINYATKASSLEAA